MPPIPITSVSDPRISEYIGVREAELRRDRFDAPGGLFVAEGELVFRRLLASRYRTRSILSTPSRLSTIADAIATLPSETPVYTVDQRTMNDIVGFNIHRGLLAIGERGPEPALADLLRQARMAVVLEDLVNHDNLGGIFRNVAGLAGGCQGHTVVLLSPRCADPLYRKSIRVSMGSALLVPFGRLSDWPADLIKIKEAGFRVMAMTPDDGAADIVDAAAACGKSKGKVAIVLGSEGPGLSAQAKQQADNNVHICMPGRVASVPGSEEGGPRSENDLNGDESAGGGIDSLNVSVACAIALHRLFETTG